MQYDSKHYPESGKRFAGDAAWHQMIVLHDDGLYRHLRFARPRVLGPVHVHTSMYHFDLITWPGFLTITGDFGPSFVFSRERDMFGFFRGRDINPGYWAEKLTSGRDAASKYSEEMFTQIVTEHAGYAADQFDDPDAFLAAVEQNILGEDIHSEDAARELLDDFTYEGLPARDPQDDDEDGELKLGDALTEALGVTPEARATMARQAGAKLDTFRFTDTWEWNFDDWHWQYLWACHAILWGIRQYGKLHSPVPLGPDRAAATGELPEPVAAASG